MAERSFKSEVAKLRLGAGQEFRGEGILAVTKALLQSGVSYVSGYQGAPISHLVDVLADADDVLRDLGIRFEASANEAAAAAALAASINYPLRGAATFKSTVGTNVASDALANLASGGVTGGALIIVGEDYGEGSSIMQERSHAFAMKSQMWLVDPRPNLPSIVQAVEKSFELSEASNTPVMLELRIRACHVYGSFTARDNARPAFTLRDALDHPRRDANRIVLPPASYLHEREKVEKRWPAAVRFIEQHKLNEFFDGDAGDIGIVMQGGMYNTALRALELLGLADVFGASRIPLYVLNVTYPLIDAEFARFCVGKKAILIIEEGQPEFIEQAVNTILRRADIQTRVEGKGMLPMAGEYTGGVMKAGLRKFVAAYRPDLLPDARAPAAAAPDDRLAKAQQAVAGKVHGRPPSFCTGCPERPIFAAMKLVERELGAAPRELRYRLPPVLDPAAVQSRQHHHGLWPRRRRRRGAQRRGRQTRHRPRRRRRVLAQRPRLERRQCRLQQERQRADRGRQRLFGRDRRTGRALLRRQQQHARDQESDREGGARRRRHLGAHAHAHL